MMAAQNARLNFNALTVPLQGSNLIEASAGTGKTYSIAILALRLILENKFSIKEILMVTFTKAAVAELEERIRLFIRSAYRICKGENIDDKTIADLVLESIKKTSAEETSDLLKEAIIFLDETSVMTIHSFCQQTLTEFAFETNQLFGAELKQDISDILEEEVQTFWRKNITTIHPELLAILMNANLSQSIITTIVKQHLDGKHFGEYDSLKAYTFCQDDHLYFLKALRQIHKKEEDLRLKMNEFVINNSGSLKQKSIANVYTNKNNVVDLIDNPDAFIDYLIEKKRLTNIEKVFQDTGLLDDCSDCEKIKEEINIIIQNCLNQILCVAINEISAGVKKYKLSTNQLSFDDLIVNLHAAIVQRDNPSLVAALKKKYRAVFIDEFQDTDRLQYEVFKAAFGIGTVLFYIGDPKQSIYAWRKADIFTYFKAYNDVDNIYQMNVNFRSTEALINAMNLFFLPEENFDTFHFGDMENAVKYIPVKSPSGNKNGQLIFNDADCVPLTLDENCKKKDEIAEDTALQALSLLNDDGYSIIKGQVKRKIIPSDIGILVRNKSDGILIKNALSKYYIPSVTVTDAKVLQSEEAVELLYVLEAFLNHSVANINRALLTSFTGYKTKDILSLEGEKAVLLFKNYKTTWEISGVYSALKNFIIDFGVQKNLLERSTESGERTITNLYQLIELLFKTQAIKKLSPVELIDWLKRGIEQKKAEGDELLQRIESDEEAIRIVTIHSSKGLQYNIVFAPFLDFTTTSKHEDCSYRDEDTSEYITVMKKQLSDDKMKIYIRQLEQENRRLLYVAITRAVYKCFIYRNTFYKTSSLATFTANLNESPGLIERKAPISIRTGESYKNTKQLKSEIPLREIEFNLQHNNWRRMSYTMLAADLERHLQTKRIGSKDDYNQFIFYQLAKGNITGNLLHFIFENLNFSDQTKWPSIVDKAINRFAPGKKEKYELQLQQMIDHVLNANIQTDDLKFSLSEVDFGKRVHELEFDFPVALFQPSLLVDFSDENIYVNVKSFGELEGIMNGKIDLFFEYNNKYFVLDWKSTYLGDTLEDYSREALADAMNENNYHLQYLIYTLAVKKYLETRMTHFDYERDFGGVLYCFVRGMRAGKCNGVYYCKPPLKDIVWLEELLSGATAGMQGNS
jgi:exodeoxyribonuclease V beta subunit